MSLFKLKNLWTESYPNQEFDEKHLAVGRIDDAPAFALGSYKGNLRVYIMHVKRELEVTLIYQTTFQSQIIAVEFVANPDGEAGTIGILLFKKFIYLSFTPTDSSNTFQRNTITVQCQPSFRIEPKQPICLLTLNSSIQYLNPLSILNIKQSDPIFPFASKTKKGRRSIYYGDGQQLVHIKGQVEQWRVILGEIRQIQVVSDKIHSYSEDLLVAIGGNNIWEVNNASITRSKILEDDVVCGAILNIQPQNEQEFYNIAVANFQMQILIYTRNFKLIWAVKCEATPLRFVIFNDPEMKGAMAILSEEGTLDICYAGTQLTETELQDINENIDMKQVELQTARYLEEIQRKKQSSKQTQSKGVISQKSRVKLKVRAMIPTSVGQHVECNYKLWRQNNGVWSCKIQCNIITQHQSIVNVNLSIVLPSNIFCSNQNQIIPLIKKKETAYFSLYCSSEKFPYDCVVEVLAKYQSNEKKNSVSILKQRCRLPIDFQSSFVSSQLLQKPSNKIVMKANKQLPELTKIFSEFGKLNDPKNITIDLPNQIRVSLGYNKTFTKVKIESNYFSGLCFLFMAFLVRLRQLSQVSEYLLTIQAPPLEELASIMKQHYEKRKVLEQAYKQLQKKCEQFRSGEKRLLMKLKEKMSSSNQIQKLLQYTYQRLLEAADQYERHQQELQIINHNLEIALKFVMELTFMKAQATQKCQEKARGIIGYEDEKVEMSAYGWEEKVMGNSAYYLNKQYNYLTDKHTFEQVYKIVVWTISKVNSGQWNQ